jgi:predicted  nucleic acid-binding Zn-ribbon protein
MTDQVMIQLAKLQTENRNLKQDIKKSTQLLLQRDDEKTELQKEIDKRQQLIDFLNKQLNDERKDNEKNRKSARRKK